MEMIEARILLKNLLNRVETLEDGRRQLPGTLTADELAALHLALSILDDGAPVPPSQTASMPLLECPQSAADIGQNINDKIPESQESEALFEINLSVLDLSPPPPNVRLCLDFGTAMSKATLIEDNLVGEDNEEDFERIEVLELGIPGAQEHVSPTMLVSSVYIDNNGLLWFGQAAVDRSLVEGQDGPRRRLDNIKRSLSEGTLEIEVTEAFNPTSIRVTYRDIVLAYMMFFTWAVSHCVEQSDLPRNLPRRFAMPCLPIAEGKDRVHELTKLLGEAQILADTFDRTLRSGIPLNEFIAAVASLRSEKRAYGFVAESVTEPLGIAGSMLSWRSDVDTLVMVIDVGAGTSDFSLFRIKVKPDMSINTSKEAANSARMITEAGNHLDYILIEILLKKADVTLNYDDDQRVRYELELKIRDHKETLFNEGFVNILLLNGIEVEIMLEEFLELKQVKKFGEDLRKTMQDILNDVDPSWVTWVQADPTRSLTVATTGGGGTLPMVKRLAEGSINVRDATIPLAHARRFPAWLSDVDANLEADYPQIAVSLGGARRNLIRNEGQATITAGDVREPAALQGYYQKGH